MAELIGMSNAAWKRQPRGPAIIQHRHSAIVDLALIGGQRSLVKGGAYSDTGVPIGAGSAGLTHKGDGSAYINAGYRAFALPLTYVALFSSSSATMGCIAGEVDDSTPYIERAFVNSADGGNSASSGYISFAYRDVYGDLHTIQSASSLAINDSASHCMVFSMRKQSSGSNNSTLCLDGKIITTSINYQSGNLIYDQTGMMDYPVDILSQNARGSHHPIYSGFDLYLFARLTGDLSDSLLLDLSANPWQLFAPAPSRFYLIPSSGGVITLIVQNASHNHAVESPSLTQAHVLALAESLHGHTVESPLLSQAYALTLAAAAHTHTVDALDLTQAHSLSVAEASHNHSADNVSLFQAHILNLSDALHEHSVEAPILTMAGSLLIDESYHGQTSESPTLTQAHTITVQDTTHGHSVEALTLTQAYVLVPADTTHGHSSEAPTLSTELNLLVADSLHSHTVEAPGLTQAHVLSLADSLHGHSAEAVSMGQGYSLIVADASHNHSVESPAVSVAFVLAIQDALHNQAADSLALATHVTLIVSDTLHAHLAGTASEITLPTGDRIFLVTFEDRLFLVATEDRLFGV